MKISPEPRPFKKLFTLLPKQLHEWLPIFGSHVKRIGYLRVILGGFTMYISLPFFFVYHLFMFLIVFNESLFFLLGLKKLNFKNYIIIDRFKIEELPWFDRINCMYCGYANGLASFYEAKLVQINEDIVKKNSLIKLSILFTLLLITSPVAIIFNIHGYIVYDLLVSRILGMHRLSYRNAFDTIETGNNENYLKLILLSLFRYHQSESERLINSLEQIESSWCPINHFNKESHTVYPKHHSKFFSHDQILKIKNTLQSEGTVSTRKPTW
jgi:hypothetical protein